MSDAQDILIRLHDAVKGGKRMLVHKVFHYRCQEPSCGLIKPIYIGYGVEGPMEIKPISIASPFGGPPCDVCEGPTQHDRIGRDLDFEPRVPPAGAYVWCVPAELIEAETFSSYYMGTHFIAGR